MAITKALSTIIAAGTTNAAGATTTGTPVDLTTKYGALVTVKITNGGTSPTLPAQALIYTSGDGANWKLFYSFAASTTASGVNEWPIDIPRAAMNVRVDITGNTVQSVTCEAFAQVVTGL